MLYWIIDMPLFSWFARRLPAGLGWVLAVAGFVLAPGGLLAQNAPPLKMGFPVTFAESPTNQVSPVGSQVLAADLGLTPGFKSIIFGLRNGKLYVVQHNANGSWGVAPGWPRQLPAHVYSSPAVGDLNNDGIPDIVVGFGSTFDTGKPGGARAFDRAGNTLWTVTTQDVTPGPADGLADPVESTPAIGDVDGDGTVEVVFGGLDHLLYVVNGENGLSNNPAIWPKDMQDTVFSSPALFDLDGDGKLDIIVGTDSYLDNGGRLRVLRYDGTEFPGFPKILDQVVSSSPVVGDIDGDGKPEIIHGTGTFFANRLERVYAWKCDGSAVPGWPVTVSGQVGTSPALADLDGDGAPEVVVTADNTRSSSVFHLYAFKGNGSQLFSTVVKDFFGNSLSAGEPVIADVLGSTGLEVLVPTNGEVAIFDSAGTELTETDNFPDDPSKPNLMTQDSLAGVAVTDLETDGAGAQIEVIAVSGQPFPDQTTTAVYAWNPVARTSTPPWGFFHHDEKRRGVAPGTPACASCTPSSAAANFFTVSQCRAVDTRNPNGPLGGPPLSAGVSRTFLVGPACGVPAGAKAVSVNVTVIGPTAGGNLQFSPGGCTTPPLTSTINFSGGQTRSNNAILPLAADGSGGLTARATVLANGSVHVIIDVNGFFQ
ncbi:MAG: hypothetical protein QOJ16_3523 [Acidobacteriota bacterium]|jgi:hypothetical protein|nr:hypothetical protein [Acidobacteriota bacterium]